MFKLNETLFVLFFWTIFTYFECDACKLKKKVGQGDVYYYYYVLLLLYYYYVLQALNSTWEGSGKTKQKQCLNVKYIGFVVHLIEDR